jgi:non-specific serine/threonine protein kinase
MTGYERGEVVGRDCRFLQGRGTDREAVGRIRAALSEGRPCSEKLLNYRKDGQAFWNHLTISPLRGPGGDLRAFVGVQSDVTAVSEGASPALLTAPQLVCRDGRAAAEGASVAGEVQDVIAPPAARAPRVAVDLATSIERIQSSFVVADAALPDTPIVFASDAFLDLTGYRRDEVVGRNCRFLQGPRTDQAAVARVREAVASEQEVAVQLLNYTKGGREFLNFFQMSPVRDSLGKCRFFVGVQIDLGAAAADSAGPPQEAVVSPQVAHEGRDRAQKVSRGLAAMAATWPTGLEGSPWAHHLGVRRPPPHQAADPLWQALLRKEADAPEGLVAGWFRKLRKVGTGDAGVVYLAELRGYEEHRFGIKVLRKSDLLARNKTHRLRQEIDALSELDHPFISTMYGCYETSSHVHLLLDFCPGGDLLSWLLKQKGGVLPEERAKWYVGQMVLALQYIHCRGVVHRDLKPENILLTEGGHLKLTDFDLSFSPGPRIRLDPESAWEGVSQLNEQPEGRSNSFVGTAEFIAPEVVLGKDSYSSGVDWWGLGILTYEILYGRTPFKGKTRADTFKRIARGRVLFPEAPAVSSTARRFIQGLLEADPAARLGCRRGAAEVQRHPFFSGVRWALLADARHAPPP